MKWAGRKSNRKVLKRWRRTDSIRVNETQTGRILVRENGEKQTGAQREADRQGEGDRQTEAANQQWREKQKEAAEKTRRETEVVRGEGRERQVLREELGNRKR